jgi:DNA-binding GntR family transcriptional regulator
MAKPGPGVIGNSAVRERPPADTSAQLGYEVVVVKHTGFADSEKEPDRGAADKPAGPLWKHAYDTLARMIQEKEVAVGQPVVELQLAQQLGVSRTPLRQALQRLEMEGLLLKSGRQSYVVRRVELKEYLQSLRVRELLEAEAAALSAGRVPPEAIDAARANLEAVRAMRPYDKHAHWRSDDEVHSLFIDRCGNDTMAGILRDLRVATKLFEIERLSERLDPDSRQHERILDALARREPEAARAAVADHIRSLFDFALETIG